MNEKLSDPKKTIEVIQKYQFAFQKRFGQNFLIDAHVLEKIVSAAGITKDDCVLEIGPGIGTMTQYSGRKCRTGDRSGDRHQSAAYPCRYIKRLFQCKGHQPGYPESGYQ